MDESSEISSLIHLEKNAIFTEAANGQKSPKSYNLLLHN